jgi:histidinol-phosphate aminotransferase
VQVPFGVSTPAQVAAIASLAAEEELLARVAVIVAERHRMDASLAELGLHPAVSEANFVWLTLGERTMDFARTCEQAGITVRPFDGEGVRITIGEPAANDRLVSIATEWVAASSS